MKYLNKRVEILNLAAQKKVLHLGCVGFADSTAVERVELIAGSLHAALSSVATVTGIDSSAEVVARLKELGHFDNILAGDVENLGELTLDEKFDVIVAGDIIEHLANPGLFLSGIKRFFHRDTLLILTTPNAFGLLNFGRFALNRFHEGKEHVMMFNAENITQLLARYGFMVKRLDTCFQPAASRYGLFFHAGKAFFSCFPKWGGTLFVVAKPQWPIAERR